MTAYLVRRLLWLPVLLILISLVTFALGVYGPGDPVTVMMGLRANPKIIEQVRKEYGFDRPFLVQYFNYVTNAVQGNFGYSLVKYQGQPVGALIAKRLPVTIQLNFVSILWSLPLGIALGVLAALKRGTWIDFIIRGFVILGISLPIIGLMPVLNFAVARKHEIGPLTIGPFLPVGGWEGMFAPHIIMPAFLLGLGILAIFTRQTRAAMIEVMTSDYIRTAHAKGLKEWMVIVKHALRNAMIPLITLIGFVLAGLFAGSFIVEQFFSIPGAGALAYESLLSKDYYVILAFTLMAATIYVIINLLIDITYAFVDPRIRYK
ncbi:MAG: ABC transporter permease [Chloroflexota bacterium]|nr:MAG: ABC transporter permease [Chloroflexota bacterium]